MSSIRGLSAQDYDGVLEEIARIDESVMREEITQLRDEAAEKRDPMVQEGNFDPYYKWLGIPPEEQPPNHYRLLGVRLYETDIEVIESAADQRMSYVQQLATGPYSDLSQTLLNELAKARVCLLNSDKKADYDISLRKLLAKVHKRAQKKQQEREADEFEELEPVLPEPTGQRRRPGSRKQGQRRRSNWKQFPWMVIGVAAVAVGFASWGTYRLLNSDGSAVTVAKDDTTTPVPEVAAGTGTSSKEAKGEKAAPSPTKKDMGATEPVQAQKKDDAPPKPAVAPFDATQAKQQQQAWAVHLGTPVETTNSIGMKLKLIPAGTFTMSEGGEAHKVTLTKPFELGVYEVTQEQYEQVMGTNPSHFKGSRNPVEKLDWNGAAAFCQQLSQLPEEKAAGRVYRLPTEAEWEYVCRAGTTTKYSFGDSESELGDYAWHKKNSGGTTHPVGGKKPNGWGMYDMHGNVYEWCQDWYGRYPSGSTTDPTGAASGTLRVRRGGCWVTHSADFSSAYRGRLTPGLRHDYLGFRVVLEIPVRAQPNSIAAETKSLPPSLQEGLVAYYPFNGNANDESGNGHDGTVDDAAFGIDRFDSLDKSYGFNSAGRIRIPDDHLLDIKDNDSLTISVWVFFVPGSDRQFIVSKQNTVPIDGRSPCYFLHLNHLKEGNLQLVVQDRRQRQVTITSSISKLHYGKWHHLVAVIDKSRASGGLFLDGVAMTSRTTQEIYLSNKHQPTDEFVQSLENDGDLFLGSGRDKHHFNGQLDDIRIYDRALSAAEVKALYDFEKP